MIIIRENFDLKEHNTFAVSARCRYFVESDSEQELLSFIADYELDPNEILILGGGSNILFTEDFPGVVFHPVVRGFEIVKEDEESVEVRVGCGEVWDDFVDWSVRKGYGGVENLSLIPGNVGSTPVQNIGAYGVEVGERISSVEAIDLLKAKYVTIDPAYCRFGYRDSIFKHEWRNHFIITKVSFRLDKKPVFRLEYGSVKQEVEQRGGASLEIIREAVISIRNSKLPAVSEIPNAGSFFKNPIVDKEHAENLLARFHDMPMYPIDDNSVKLAAGWLIEKAEWKGKSLGRAGVHDKQALVLVNKGGASGMEIVQLANEIKKRVFMQFGVWLDAEVNII